MLAEQMPPKIKRSHLKTFPDGREVLNLDSTKGKQEYKRRRTEMWERQRNLCPICTLYIPFDEASFEHEDLRSGGRRDDRIWKVDEEGNKMPYNFAVHKLCNVAKGSKRTLNHPEAA